MAITNFIPQIWSARVAAALQENAVLAPIFRSEYEGDASKGNQVNITGVVPPDVNDYAAAGRTTNAQDLDDDGDTLLIDQEKSFDFHVDDIDRVQAAGSFESWTTAAGRALGEDSDAYIAAQAIAGGVDRTADIEPVEGPGHAWNALRDLRKFLNQASIPMTDRYAIVNAEFEALLLANDAKLTSVDTSGTPAGLREATLGRILGFTVVTTNFLPEEAEPQVVGVWRPALAYVSQIDKVEGMRSHTKFADRVRGLHVYGAKVLTVADWNNGVQFYTGATP